MQNFLKPYIVCIIFFCCAFHIKLQAQEKYRGFLPLPLFYYTPDTRFGFGGVGIYYWRTQNPDSSYTRTSFAQILTDYTQNRQLDIWSSWNIFSAEEKYRFKGDIRYRIFADRFYGIGNQSQRESVERFQYRLHNLQLTGLKKIKRNIFVGVNFKFTNTNSLEFVEQRVLEEKKIIGTEGGNNIGLGFLLELDSRDNIVNASKGTYFLVSVDNYADFLGSDFIYHHWQIKFQKYWQMKPKHILASQTFVNLNFGEPSFINLATVGEKDILRGYAQNRFRDKHFVGTQVEYRFPIYKRWGMVSFAGIGDVFENTQDVTWHTLKYSLGAGLRFMIKRKEKLNLRLDYAIGRGENSFYFIVSEAF